MSKPFLRTEDQLLMLNEYAPYKVEMREEVSTMPARYYPLILVGVDFGQHEVLLTTAFDRKIVHQFLPIQLLPVLYSLADLPNLPGGDSHRASPVGTFLHTLNFIQRGDYASGEWVNKVTVKSASDSHLHLAFSTTYISLESVNIPDYDADETLPDEDDFNPEDGIGADYEAIVGATGHVQWRNVTADELDEANGGRPHWRVAEGAHVFEAFRYLRQLHVAVGKAAYVHQEWSTATNSHTLHYSYVRKQVSATQEGGPADA
jgi:hypothetical protein